MKNFEKITSILVSIFIISFSILFFVNEKKVFSETENRYLEKSPKYSFSSLKRGTYTKGIDNYLTDHFPLRNEMISIKTETLKLTGRNYINSVYLGSDGYLLEEFKGLKNISKITNVVNSLEDKVDSKISFILIPTSVEINRDKLPNYAVNESEREAITNFYNNLKVNTIDVYNALMANKQYELYYKLDHHYTTYGAYFTYLKFCVSSGIKPYVMADFNITKVTDEFYGTLYSKTNDYSLKPDSIYTFNLNNKLKVEYKDTDKITDSLYDESYLDKKDKYSYFLDNNHSLIEITNESIDNNDSILLIKDSYANSFIPFIVNHYKKIYVIDPRYYKESISDYIRENKIQEVLFLYNVGTIDNDLGIISIK